MITLIIIVFVLVGTIASSIYIAALAASRRPFRGDRAFLLLMGTNVITAGAYLLEGITPDVSTKLLLSQIMVLGTSTLSSVFLLFVIRYTQSGLDRPIINRAIWILPLVNVIVSWANSDLNWYYTDFVVGRFGAFEPLIFDYSWYFAVKVVVDFFLASLSLAVMLNHIAFTRPIFRDQIPIISLAVLAPLLTHLMFILGNGLDWTPLGLAIGNGFIGYALLRHRQFGLLPTANDAIIANLRDGVMTADLNGIVLELNPAVTAIAGFGSRIIGKSLTEVFGQELRLDKHEDGSTPVSQQIGMQHPDHQAITLELETSQIWSKNGRASGWIVLLRDVTRELALEDNLAAHTRALEKQNERQSALADLGLMISQTNQLHPVLNTTIELLERLFPAPAGASIAVWNSELEQFEDQVSSIDEHVIEPLSTEARERGGAMHWVVQNQELLVVNDTSEDPFGHSKRLADAGIGAYASMPLIAGGRVVGTLFANDSQPRNFSPADLRFLRALAERAAWAVHRTKLFNKIDRQAKIDDLTRLWNRRQLFVLGEKEMGRAERYARPLSALMVDIDNFKSINDRFGHRTGDEVLVMLAARMSDVLRSFDVIGRYGGEEFVAVLPEVGEQEARAIAERLCDYVRDQMFSLDGLEIKLTISVGIAMRNAATASFASLIDQADIAMYQSKNSGRDQVSVFRSEQESV
jgi:diguanylate cyclase (GGDEF)-like protein/PAS domain S-box-containing protein